MMVTYIDVSHTSFYISKIQKLAFYLPHVRIIWNIHCGNTLREALKRCRENQCVLCRRNYDEIVVDIFSHQIQSKY